MCLFCSGIISQDKDAIEDAMVSVKRNGVGLKGQRTYLLVILVLFYCHYTGVLRTRLENVEQQSLNKLLRLVHTLTI